ncbi:MAG: SAM-dependent methyltransferase [Oscillospiraceae bacterium]|nr:SAM-dependent methyltransferase [Oscillospiraceae bacterium]
MDSIIKDDIRALAGKIKKMTLSDCCDEEYEFRRIAAHPFTGKSGMMWQLERYKNNQVFHRNLSEEEFLQWLEEEGAEKFRQICLIAEGTTLHYTVFPDRIKRKASGNTVTAQARQHNKQKQYILPQGENIPALCDLGIFDSSFHVIKSKYDKYKQINRFIEIIDDGFSKMNRQEITILDFGCGKSYLTFIVYYYFTQIKKVKAKVIGYDLKEDVVRHCNEIAEKYGYHDLKFYVNDVTKGELYEGKVDMVITLHACDTATDYALYHALSHGVPHIFSVPCCQHEICSSIRKGGDFDWLLSHGLIKERFSALLTDSLRAEILRRCGYEVDVLEFVDFAHSPKNLMLRCRLKKRTEPDLSPLQALMDRYGFTQKLYELCRADHE